MALLTGLAGGITYTKSNNEDSSPQLTEKRERATVVADSGSPKTHLIEFTKEAEISKVRDKSCRVLWHPRIPTIVCLVNLYKLWIYT